MSEFLLIGLVSIIALGVIAQWLAWRLHLPAILLLLVSGIIAGPVTGLLNPDALLGDILAPIVSISVAIILFEGGLSLRLRDLQEIGWVVGKLITIGIVITWVLATIFSLFLLDLNLELSILFGAILIVTGPTVIIPLMRQVRPAGKIGSVLKWEGIVNDPIGAMMAVLVFEIILTGGLSASGGHAFVSILKTVVFGSLTGLLGAILIYYLLKRHLVPDFLQNPVTLMVTVTVFAVSNLLQHESGLLAVTIMGIALANQKAVRVKHIIDFKEDLRVLLISALFIMLAARLKVEHLEYFNLQAFLFLLALIIIVRPASIFLSTIGTNLSFKEKLFLSWMAPRGIVAAAISAIFAIELSELGYEQADHLIPYTFLVIIGTVAIYGPTANWFACRLGLAKPTPRGVMLLGGHEWSQQVGLQLKESGFKVLVADSNWDNISKARKKGLDTYYGNILAEYAMEEMDLDGVGRILAITHNDEVNSLAILRFSELFGSSEVFQLAPMSRTPRKEREVPDDLSGRILFGSAMNFDYISELFDNGAYLETHTLKDTDHYKKLVSLEGQNRIPLFFVSREKEIEVFAADFKPEPAKGKQLITLTLPEDQSLEQRAEQEPNTQEQTQFASLIEST